MNYTDLVINYAANEMQPIAGVIRYNPRQVDDTYTFAEFSIERQPVTKWESYFNESELWLNVFNRCQQLGDTEIYDMHSDLRQMRSSRWRAEEFSSRIMHRLMTAVNQIAINTARGRGNLIIVNQEFYAKLMAPMLAAQPTFIAPNNHELTGMPRFTIFGSIELIVLPFDDSSNYPIAVVTYHGANQCDGGMVLIKDEETRRYSLLDSFRNTDKYYITIKFDAGDPINELW